MAAEFSGSQIAYIDAQILRGIEASYIASTKAMVDMAIAENESSLTEKIKADMLKINDTLLTMKQYQDQVASAGIVMENKLKEADEKIAKGLEDLRAKGATFHDENKSNLDGLEKNITEQRAAIVKMFSDGKVSSDGMKEALTILDGEGALLQNGVALRGAAVSRHAAGQ